MPQPQLKQPGSDPSSICRGGSPLTQACHELVPPEQLEPVLNTLVDHFVSDKSRPEMVAIGINTTREVCIRVPLAMNATLLADLIEYRKDRAPAVVAAARSLLLLFRQKMPTLLPKKYRGRGVDLSAMPAQASVCRPRPHTILQTTQPCLA